MGLWHPQNMNLIHTGASLRVKSWTLTGSIHFSSESLGLSMGMRVAWQWGDMNVFLLSAHDFAEGNLKIIPYVVIWVRRPPLFNNLFSSFHSRFQERNPWKETCLLEIPSLIFCPTDNSKRELSGRTRAVLRITRSQLGKHSYPAHSLIAQEAVQKMKKKCVWKGIKKK